MKRLRDLAIHRGIPLAIGFFAMHAWGDDTRNREWIIFGLAVFVTHAVLLVYDLSLSLGKISPGRATQTDEGERQRFPCMPPPPPMGFAVRILVSGFS